MGLLSSGPLAFLRRDERGVTPVVGSLMILGITVVGIAGIMLWGGPTVQRIQDQNAQVAMVAEFQDVRQAALVLTVPDSSRVPTINQDQGTLILGPGGHFMVTVAHDTDPGYSGCDFHVTRWADDGDVDSVEVSTQSCRTPKISCSSLVPGEACLEVHQVTGSSTIQKPSALLTLVGASPSWTLDVSGADFREGDWLFRLTNGQTSGLVVYAQAWLMHSNRLTWDYASSRDLDVHLEAGAVFAQDGSGVFLESPPPIQEDAFGSGDFVLRLPLFTVADAVSSQGRGTPSVAMTLVGNHARVVTSDTTQVRLDYHGELAEAWCRTMLLRNSAVPTGAAYTEDAAFGCEDGDVDGVRSLTYVAPSSPFRLEFFHARIKASLTT